MHQMAEVALSAQSHARPMGSLPASATPELLGVPPGWPPSVLFPGHTGFGRAGCQVQAGGGAHGGNPEGAPGMLLHRAAPLGPGNISVMQLPPDDVGPLIESSRSFLGQRHQGRAGC